MTTTTEQCGGILPGGGEQPLLVICLATYRPDPALLAATLASIKSETHRNWICLIRDDASGDAHVDSVRSLIADDARFRLVVNPVNLGYTGNFEALLGDVPSEASYVALADQDDVWHEDRLERLVGYLQQHPEAELVYHNVELITPSGERLAESYEVGRPPTGGASLSDLLMANLVTGWTSVFRRRLLDLALPFPRRGPWVHDHWLACAARARGPLGYLSEPLGGYVQHGRNAVGAGSRGVAYWGSHLGALVLAWPMGVAAGLTRFGPMVRPVDVLVDWTLAQYRVRQSFVAELKRRGAVAPGYSAFPTRGRSSWIKGLVRQRAVAGSEAWAALLHFRAGELARSGRIKGTRLRRRFRA